MDMDDWKHQQVAETKINNIVQVQLMALEASPSSLRGISSDQDKITPGYALIQLLPILAI